MICNPVPLTITKWCTFKHLRWTKKFHQSTQVYETSYTDRYSEDEQLLTRPLCGKQKYEHGGRLKFKISILFYGDNSSTVTIRLT
jgi:hypothetical protein